LKKKHRIKPKKRSTVDGNIAHGIGPGGTALGVSYDADSMPNFTGNSASYIAAGGVGFLGVIKPGPDHMPSDYVDHLEKFAGYAVSMAPVAVQDRFYAATEKLRSPDRETRLSALYELGNICNSERSSHLSLEIAHWMAGDFDTLQKR
jgi:hypothetical protein